MKLFIPPVMYLAKLITMTALSSQIMTIKLFPFGGYPMKFTLCPNPTMVAGLSVMVFGITTSWAIPGHSRAF